MDQQTPFELKPQAYSLADEFGIDVPKTAMIAGYAAGHPAAPEIDRRYVFMRAKLRDMLAFWESGLPCFKIRGDMGTGKSSIVEQFHARLRWPLAKVLCHPSLEAFSMMGQLMPTLNGTLRWVDGPVLAAARHGYSVLLDEWNVLDPGQATGLNLLLDGYAAITIPETGEIVKVKPGFRVFATENPVDSRLVVAGRNTQDAASDDRWMVTDADYLPPELERKAVMEMMLSKGTDAGTAELTAKVLVDVANRVRAAYRSQDEAIDKPMSTRVVMRWATLIRRFQNVKPEEGGPALYALRRSFAMNPEMARAVEDLHRAAIGS